MKRLFCISLIACCLIGCNKKTVIKGTDQPTIQPVKAKYIRGCPVVKGPNTDGTLDYYLVERNGCIVCVTICNTDGSFCDWMPKEFYEESYRLKVVEENTKQLKEMAKILDNTGGIPKGR